jgi:hypothetical protein
MRPAQTLGFLLAVGLALAAIGALWPRDGITLAEGVTITMPSPKSILFPEQRAEVDISDIVALPTDSALSADTVAVATVDSMPPGAPFVFDASKLPPLHERIALHYPQGDKSVLHELFATLKNAGQGSRPVRVLHYGDSQIEGDRITSYLRNKLQTQFGGSGPGLVSVADIVPFYSVERVLSDNWERYAVMGRKHPTQKHDRFGALGSFSRFTPILPDTVAPDTTVHQASVLLRPEKRSYGKAQVYEVCKLYYGWHRSPLTVELWQDGVLVSSDEVAPSEKLLIREWRFPSSSGALELRFTGADSPDVFGISLESKRGVCMDNLALRGGAGYEFGRMDQALLRGMYDDLGVDLLILQFGGNVLPSLKSAEEAAGYGRFLGAQIARFKRLMPGVTVMVIGPSDMSIKEGEFFVTRPFLEDVNTAMKTNALAQGAVFWDMYAAMGGRNSMVSWVEADPPLAATDYIHFSPQGARKVGELFWTAFINDFAQYHSTAP